MARAEAAHASARSDSIKGLAQSVAKRAYRRLLPAEPALRRAVPSLIVAFLVTVGIGAIIQVNDRHRQAVVPPPVAPGAWAGAPPDPMRRHATRTPFPRR